MKSELWVSAFDLHYPDVHWPTFYAMMAFLKRNRVHGFVFGGDQLNNECISHHTKGKPEFRPTGQFAMDEAAFDQQVLKPITKLLYPEGRKVWIVGNHDYWEQEYEQEHPPLKGKLQRPHNLDLENKGWNVIPLGGIYKRGKMSWIHGEGLSGMHHAKKAVEVYCTNVNYGHFHALQTFTKVLSSDFRQKWVAQCNPILGNVNPRYLEGRPNAWVNGFTVTEFYRGGHFNNYPIVVNEGEAAYGGKIYKG